MFPGAFANVHLFLPLKKSPTVIPVNALIFRSEGSQVAVADKDGVVHLRKVSIGQDYGTTLEITDGVNKDDWIVLNPPDSLADGTKVQVHEMPGGVAGALGGIRLRGAEGRGQSKLHCLQRRGDAEPVLERVRALVQQQRQSAGDPCAGCLAAVSRAVASPVER